MANDKANFFKSLVGKKEEQIDKVIETVKQEMTEVVKPEETPKPEPLETTDYAFSILQIDGKMQYDVVKIGFNRQLKRQTSFEVVDSQDNRDSAIESFKVFVARSSMFG